MTNCTRRGEGSASRPGSSLLPGETRYPLYRRLGGPQGRSGQVRKISPPPRFDPRTVQPVTSRYTDYATRPTDIAWVTLILRARGPNPDLESFTLTEEFHTDHQSVPFPAKWLPIHGNISHRILRNTSS
jgi:hypothetical protein